MKFPSLALLLLVLVAGCSRHESGHANAVLPAVRVNLAPVQAENLPYLTEVTGTVRSVQRAVLAAKVMGAITHLPVTLGQQVQQNQLLLKLYSAEAEARVTQARAQLNVAERDFARESDLLSRGASTAESVRTLQDRLTGCTAALHEAETQLGYTEIRAPFAGVISRKLVQSGDLAAPGQPLLELEGASDFEIEACIPDSLVAALTPGAVFACDAEGSRFAGAVREISSSTDPATRSIGVKISIPGTALVRSGQFTRIHIPGSTHPALLIPASAVSVKGQLERVFVLGEGNRAGLRLVKTGPLHGDRREILSGLSVTDRVVVAPPSTLREGQPLEETP